MRVIFSHPIEVRFRDCDPMGHVNNAVYLTYLEQARLAQWRALWGFGRSRGGGDVPGVILARVEVDYRLPARFGEMLDVRIGLAALGRTSFTYEYEIVNAEGGTVAVARSVQVMYDYGAARPVPIPDDIRRLFDAL
jgi:acyl-CoA thioester hydrolase